MGFADFDAMSPQEARDHAKRWAAGRDERFAWLRRVTGADPSSAALTELWPAIVAWHEDGGAERSTAPLPIWWAADDEDAGDVRRDALVMADALAHRLRDELLGRMPALRAVVHEDEGDVHHHQPVLALDVWTISPVSVAYSRLRDLRPDAPKRRGGQSLDAGYLESVVAARVRQFAKRARELERDAAP